AGAALVFPLLMLTQMMSAGGMGGGISSAIARAVGGGRLADAEALARHALVIALVFGAIFTAGVLAGGPWLYRAMGGREEALRAALAYSNVLFAGAILLWLLNSLSNVLRGTGNMALPAAVLGFGTVGVMVVSPALIFGLGPIPPFGMAGAAAALVIHFAIGTAIVGGHLVLGRGLVRLRAGRLEWRYFADILKVGVYGIATTLIANLAVAVATGFVGVYGVGALAGYGIGARLEYMQIPIAFSFGAALVAMVGMNVGAGQRRRAVHAAWAGALMVAGVTEVIGLAAALFPISWLSLFTTDPHVIDAGATYFRIVGPFYGFLGLAMALYFASQGTGRMNWPLAAGVIRFLVVAIAGAIVANVLGAGLAAIFAVLSLALLLFGLVNAVPWFGRLRDPDWADRPQNTAR
ncbi:MAG: MATE family efflux transporter, partial [Alphaproteobacteria bacterium]